ncbi:MAG: hypothetical protein KME42_06715 [Tildeniella nuda ZEHNDER 1965/U140]|nr:hypothetical protein [Tildeniella nuda ZEHNDER 1965/U140]
MTLTKAELDTLYRRSAVGQCPNGDSKGTLILAPGSKANQWLAAIAKSLVWQGKGFNQDQGSLLNKVLPFGLKLVKAQVYLGVSWIDGKDAIILDYSTTSFIAQKIRDEIRQIAPGIYLGRSFWDRTHILDFVLEF